MSFTEYLNKVSKLGADYNRATHHSERIKEFEISFGEYYSGRRIYIDDGTYIYVAVLGNIGDFACYYGSNVSSVEYVSTNGIKMAEQEAYAIFPYLAMLNYRK